MGALKEKLLKCLRDDPDIRKVLDEIVVQILNEKTKVWSNHVQKPSSNEEEWSQVIDLLETIPVAGMTDYPLNRKVEKCIQILKKENDELKREVCRYQKALEQRSEATEKVNVLQEQVLQLENQRRAFQKKNHFYLGNLEKEKEKNTELQTQLRNQNKQIQERFSSGYACYLAYQQLDFPCKRKLSGFLYHADQFENFICCLAQPKNVEKIWDVMFDCVMAGEQDNADILNDLFTYALELVNKTLSHPNFARLLTKPGDWYDTDLHRITPDSANQGKVQEVYLEGYRNLYNQQVLRKSLVSVARE